MSDKRQRPEDQDPFQAERRINARAALRVLLALYLAYVIYQLVKAYQAGDSGMSLPVFAAAVLFFSAAEVVIFVFALKRWKRGRDQVEQAWAAQEAQSSGPEAESTLPGDSPAGTSPEDEP